MYKIPATTLFLGKNLIFMPECHSTNDLALKLCQKPEWMEGTLVITNNQTAGRGQRGNNWIAAPGENLTFSFLIKPGVITVREQFYLNLFVSLGIRDYLTRLTDTKVQIKWPNDILVNDKKICGILIENQLGGDAINASVIGIGLNINQQHFNIDTATSLKLLTGNQYELSDELGMLLQHIEWRYMQMKERKFGLLLADYLDCLHRRNENHLYSSAGEQFEGTISGIDEVGRLKVKVGDKEQIFDVKGIQYN